MKICFWLHSPSWLFLNSRVISTVKPHHVSVCAMWSEGRAVPQSSGQAPLWLRTCLPTGGLSGATAAEAGRDKAAIACTGLPGIGEGRRKTHLPEHFLCSRHWTEHLSYSSSWTCAKFLLDLTHAAGGRQGWHRKAGTLFLLHYIASDFALYNSQYFLLLSYFFP